MNKNRLAQLNLSQDYPSNFHQQIIPEVASKQMSRTHKRIETSPGPGAYNISPTHQTYNKNKGITISGHNRTNSKIDKKPDPWTYIPKNEIVQPKSPKATIGRERKFQKLRQLPGPADYNYNYRTICERSRITFMGSSRKDQHIQRKPGPADYDPLSSHKRVRRNISTIIGREERDRSPKDNLLPGPDQYKIEDEFLLNVKNRTGYSMMGKVRSKTVCGQAPENYFKYNADKLKTLYKAPSYSIQKEQKRQKKSISPGPADYSPKHQNKEGITMPKSERPFTRTESGSLLYYVPNKEVGPSFSIPKAPRQSDRRPFRPGPTDYKPQPMKSQKYKSIGIGMSDRQSNTPPLTPAPGDYNIFSKPNRSGFTIGNEQRPNPQKKVLPGPADYFLSKRTGGKYFSQKK